MALQMMTFPLITHTATGLGTLVIAAHQVVLQVFWFFSYFLEPLTLSAQSLMARDKVRS